MRGKNLSPDDGRGCGRTHLSSGGRARQTCHDAGSHVMCETSGSVSIKAVPQTRAPNVSEITPNVRDRRRGIVWSW